MVAHEPGPWFEETLSSLAVQDYPNLRYLFIDAGTTNSVPKLVHGVLPEAQVFSLHANPGFSKAINEVLDADGLAPYLLLCHDDVAFEPDAIRRLFEEAIRSNAGVLGPKLVDWDDSRLIREVGIGIDKTGVRSPYAEPGEFDQEQHDAVRDVFAVSSTAMLVRTDLFIALGGFDEVMAYQGEDIDLCWRAHAAGARVMVVPLAVVRHRENMSSRHPQADGSLGSAKGLETLQHRHRVRMLLANYGFGHALRVIPQAIIAALASIAHALFSGRFDRVGHLVKSWTWNFANIGSVIAKRRRVSGLRQLSDSEVRRFQVPGFDSINRYVQSRAEGDSALRASRAQEALAYSRTGAGQLVAAIWASIIIVIGFGSRHILTQGMPVINEFGAFPEATRVLWGEWLSGLRGTGLGAEAYGPTAHGLLASLGVLFLGQMGLLRTVLTVGMLAVGAVGAVRFVAPFHSTAARALAPWIYAAVPLPYNALVQGSWGGLVLFGSLPWILRWLAASAGIEPFSEPEKLEHRVRDIVAMGVVVALGAVVVPFVIPLMVVVMAALIIGGFVAGESGRAGSIALTTFGSLTVAVILHLPWAINFFGADGWSMLAGTRGTNGGELAVVDLLRLATGPHGSGILGWSTVVVAALALVLASGDRLVWAVRGWLMVILSVGLAWLDQLGVVGASLPRPEVLLAPAALGLAIAATMLVIAVERDLGNFRFGFRQALPALAVISLLAGAIAGVGAAFDGRWEIARGGYETAMRFVVDGEEDQSRIMWIGDADALPVGGWSYRDATVGITSASIPSVIEQWPDADPEGREIVLEVLDTAMRGGTNRVGRLLAPMGVRYIVAIERVAPAPFSDDTIPISDGIAQMLNEQLDFERVDIRDGMTVYRNASWAPIVAEVPQGTASKVSSATAAEVVAGDLSGSLGPFTPDGPRRWTGEVAEGTELQHATMSSNRWELEVPEASVRAVQSRGYGWANTYLIAADGDATLEYKTSSVYRLLMIGQAIMWLLALAVVFFGPRATQR